MQTNQDRRSEKAVHRVWRKAALKPHRLDGRMASDGPDFESKADDIIGLYLSPHECGRVLGNEKPGIRTTKSAVASR